MKTVSIIPVKSFIKAKTRLSLSTENTVELCKLMLGEVLDTISSSNRIDSIIIVSQDELVFHIVKKFNVIEIFDELESGVNNAISIADKYISNSDFDASIIFPQDIPFFNCDDIENLFSFYQKDKSVSIVPSRHFNGTNALIRKPATLIETHYDEGTYKSHLRQNNINEINFSLVLIQRLMLDIDTPNDLQYAVRHNVKPELCRKILDLID